MGKPYMTDRVPIKGDVRTQTRTIKCAKTGKRWACRTHNKMGKYNVSVKFTNLKKLDIKAKKPMKCKFYHKSKTLACREG